MKRLQLFNCIQTSGVNNPNLQSILQKEAGKFYNPEELVDIKAVIKTFICKFRKKFATNNRMMSRLKQREKEWLEKDVISVKNISKHSKCEVRPGRPDCLWEDASARTKRRKIQTLRENNNTIALAKLLLTGQRTALVSTMSAMVLKRWSLIRQKLGKV